MLNVGNTWIVNSGIDPSSIYTSFATASCHHNSHSQVAEHCMLWQNFTALFPVLLYSCCYCSLVQQCFQCHCCYCLLLLSTSPPPLQPVDYWCVSTDFLFCLCCRRDCAKVGTTALAAATFGACYTTLLLPLLLLVVFVLCIAIINGWLLLFWIDFLICYFSTPHLPMMPPLLFFQWCCNCTCWCHHPFAAHYTVVPVLLPLPVIVIAIPTSWLSPF